jgi:DNA polymerase delta subunit 3
MNLSHGMAQAKGRTVNFGEDDEGEDVSEEQEDLFLDTGERQSNKPRDTRKEREEKLKRMMEDDGECIRSEIFNA